MPDVRLGAQIRKSGTATWINDTAGDKVIALYPPGESQKSRNFRIPCTLDSGKYDVRLVLFDDNSEKWLDSKESLGAVSILAQGEKKVADFNGDDLVNVRDLAMLFGQLGLNLYAFMLISIGMGLLT